MSGRVCCAYSSGAKELQAPLYINKRKEVCKMQANYQVMGDLMVYRMPRDVDHHCAGKISGEMDHDRASWNKEINFGFLRY